MPAITPSLWFDNDLEEAIEFYAAVFPNSSVETIWASGTVRASVVLPAAPCPPIPTSVRP